MKGIFETKSFAVQVISSGAFVDHPVYDGSTFLVETATVRLNRVAMSEWSDTIVNDYYRECFDTDEEFEDYVKEKSRLRLKFEQKIAQAVGFTPDPYKEKINVTQVVSEVFTVVWIHQLEDIHHTKIPERIYTGEAIQI